MSEKQMLPIAKAMLAALDRNDLAEFQRLREGVAVAKDAVNDPTVGTTFHFAPERVANVNAQEAKDGVGRIPLLPRKSRP